MSDTLNTASLTDEDRVVVTVTALAVLGLVILYGGVGAGSTSSVSVTETANLAIGIVAFAPATMAAYYAVTALTWYATGPALTPGGGMKKLGAAA